MSKIVVIAIISTIGSYRHTATSLGSGLEVETLGGNFTDVDVQGSLSGLPLKQFMGFMGNGSTYVNVHFPGLAGWPQVLTYCIIFAQYTFMTKKCSVRLQVDFVISSLHEGSQITTMLSISNYCEDFLFRFF